MKKPVYNDVIDFQRALLIVMVILVHIVNFGTLYPEVKARIFSFFMPAFLIITGYLVNIRKTPRQFGVCLLQMAIPYAIMVIGYMVLSLYLPVRDGITILCSGLASPSVNKESPLQSVCVGRKRTQRRATGFPMGYAMTEGQAYFLFCSFSKSLISVSKVSSLEGAGGAAGAAGASSCLRFSFIIKRIMIKMEKAMMIKSNRVWRKLP